MQSLIDKAAVLHEALPYIQRFRKKCFVIKYGGSAMRDPTLAEGFARDVVLMQAVGIRPIVVHGGGPQIDRELARAGIEPQRVEGLRITDDATMAIVERVLRNEINRDIVALIEAQGGRGLGLCGTDDGLLRAEKVPPVHTPDGRQVDIGRVGRVVGVDVERLQQAIEDGVIPIIAPVAQGPDGGPLNVNADTAAGEIAGAMGARKLVLMTDTDGVRGPEGRIIPSLTEGDIDALRAKSVISGGMIPKVECARAALARGVRKVHILDGRVQHAILLEIFTDRGVGTEVVNSLRAETSS